MRLGLGWQRRTYPLCSLLCLVAASCGGGGGTTPVLSPSHSPPSTGTVVLATATHSPTNGATQPTATVTPTLPLTSASATPSQTPIRTATSTPTEFATPTRSLTPTHTPTLSPTPVPTLTPLTGPIITAMGIADVGGQPNAPIGEDAAGRPIFSRTSEAGFLLYIEGRPGPSQLPVGTVLFNPKRNDPQALPDLIVGVDRALGDGSEQVCDITYPSIGGVPGTLPSDIGVTPMAADAINDLACRFRAYTEPDFACTQDGNANLQFRSGSSTVQYCILINDALTFPPGDTIVRARLRDTGGNIGGWGELVVRVP